MAVACHNLEPMPHPLLDVTKAPEVPAQPVKWGLGDSALWLVVAQVGAAIWFAVIVAIWFSGEIPDPVPIGALFGGQLGLVVAYGVGPALSSRFRGAGLRYDFGAVLGPRDIPFGLLGGVATQLLVLPLLYLPILRFVDADPSEAAEELVARADTAFLKFVLFVMVVVVAPAIEELFYRGLLLRSLEKFVGSWLAIIISAALFAIVHFQLLQLPGLFVFGLLAGFLAVRTGRLGLAWMFHVGFNLTTYVLLVT